MNYAHQPPVSQTTALSPALCSQPQPRAGADGRERCHGCALRPHPALLVLGCSAPHSPHGPLLRHRHPWHGCCLVQAPWALTEVMFRAFLLAGCSYCTKGVTKHFSPCGVSQLLIPVPAIFVQLCLQSASSLCLYCWWIPVCIFMWFIPVKHILPKSPMGW